MLSGRAAPSAPCAVAAMARARRRSRTPEGRTERRSRREHHPGHRPGKVRADAPRDTRRTGYSPTQETIFAVPKSGEYGGAGGVEGRRPLSPHAPRRAGDPPPVPGSSRRTGKERKKERRILPAINVQILILPKTGSILYPVFFRLRTPCRQRRARGSR